MNFLAAILFIGMLSSKLNGSMAGPRLELFKDRNRNLCRPSPVSYHLQWSCSAPNCPQHYRVHCRKGQNFIHRDCGRCDRYELPLEEGKNYSCWLSWNGRDGRRIFKHPGEIHEHPPPTLIVTYFERDSGILRKALIDTSSNTADKETFKHSPMNTEHAATPERPHRFDYWIRATPKLLEIVLDNSAEIGSNGSDITYDLTVDWIRFERYEIRICSGSQRHRCVLRYSTRSHQSPFEFYRPHVVYELQQIAAFSSIGALIATQQDFHGGFELVLIWSNTGGSVAMRSVCNSLGSPTHLLTINWAKTEGEIISIETDGKVRAIRLETTGRRITSCSSEVLLHIPSKYFAISIIDRISIDHSYFYLLTRKPFGRIETSILLFDLHSHPEKPRTIKTIADRSDKSQNIVLMNNVTDIKANLIRPLPKLSDLAPGIERIAVSMTGRSTALFEVTLSWRNEMRPLFTVCYSLESKNSGRNISALDCSTADRMTKPSRMNPIQVPGLVNLTAGHRYYLFVHVTICEELAHHYGRKESRQYCEQSNWSRKMVAFKASYPLLPRVTRIMLLLLGLVVTSGVLIAAATFLKVILMYRRKIAKLAGRIEQLCGEAYGATELTPPDRNLETEPFIGSQLRIRTSNVEFGDLLGGGSFAQVREGTFMGRKFALKLFSVPRITGPITYFASLYAFLKEAHALMHLRHENIIRIIDVCIDDTQPMIVMELLNGRDLKTLLGDSGVKISSSDIKRCLIDIAYGLAHINDQRYVHGDISLKNILVKLDSDLENTNEEDTIEIERFLITDFGTVSEIPCNETRARLNDHVFTPATYAAPEAISHQCYVTLKSDIYGFGILMWELFTIWLGLGAGVPFAEHRDDLQSFRQENPQAQPGTIPQFFPYDLKVLIADCWRTESQRPYITEVIRTLEAIDSSSFTVEIGPAEANGRQLANVYEMRKVDDGLYYISV